MDEVLDRCIETIDRTSKLTSEEFYFYLLVTFHEGMHAEALAYTRQTLGYPAPRFAANQAARSDSADLFQAIPMFPVELSLSARPRTFLLLSTTKNGRIPSRSNPFASLARR